MSTTVLIGQAPTNLGPLTTTFAPPAACTIAVGARGGLGGLLRGEDEGVAYLGQSCSRGTAVDATSCWPPTSKGVEAKEPPLHGWGYYSPGLHCPVGYATACSATGGRGGKSGWPVLFTLRDGETAVGCCPSGYGCANINGQTCTVVATSTTVPTVTCDGSKSGDVALQTVVPDAEASITALSLFAPMIQINWQSSDRGESTSSDGPTRPVATKTATSGRLTASGTETIDTGASSAEKTLVLDGNPDTTGAANVDIGADAPIPTPPLRNGETSSGGGSQGFSPGAKVAIGVAGAVAVIMMLVCALFYCWRRRKNQREEREMDRLYGMKHTTSFGADFTNSGDIPGWYRGQRLVTPTKDPFRGIELPPAPYYRPYRPG